MTIHAVLEFFCLDPVFGVNTRSEIFDLIVSESLAFHHISPSVDCVLVGNSHGAHQYIIDFGKFMNRYGKGGGVPDSQF